MIFGHVLLHHGPTVKPFFYSSLVVDPDNDTATKQFRTVAGDGWRDISSLNDEQAEALIRQDQIDILVDLAGHTNGGRLTLFMRKPAPIQVTDWGFAHGTGCPEIDYFFADPIAIPESDRSHYAEKIWDLPCIVTYEPPVEYNLKAFSTSPYFTRGYVTFGTYARFEKLSDSALATFAEILQAVPDSKLEFKDHGFRRPSSLRRVMAEMPDIDPSRLLFSIATTHPDHMLAYQQADLILDPFPHTGGVVGLEQIYMGVPIVTMYGTQAAGRSTSSVLTAMGKSEWIAKSPQQYVDLAVALTSDVRALARERKTLRDQLLNSPVCVGYVEAVETAYRGMWRKYIEAR
jgi:predicted O-linked N-acetylglucosamine transferase (SPINDLY family)